MYQGYEATTPELISEKAVPYFNRISNPIMDNFNQSKIAQGS